MDTRIRTGLLVSAIAVICGCSSSPIRVDSLEQARAAVHKLEQDNLATEVAATELAAARNAIEQADDAHGKRAPLDVVEHKAYVAQRYAEISKQRIAEGHAKAQIAEAQSARNRVLLQSREREAAAAEEERRKLQSELADLQAKQTERGIVVTLGDVLFDTAQATLKPGAGSTIDRLSEFMRADADRHVMIEGHTDSRGSDVANRELSERRADAVRDALVERGIDGQRIRPVGLGEAYPVASNDSAGGMQQNRRVEIVISDERGEFPGGSQRTAALRQ